MLRGTVAHAEAAALPPAPAAAEFGLAANSAALEDAAEQRSVLVRLWSGARLVCRAGFLSLLSASVLMPGAAVRFLYERGYCPATLLDRMWDYTLWSIQLAGPTYIKLAQWAASRPDLFAEMFCRRVGDVLHDDTVPHGWPHTARMLESALGSEWDKRLVLDRVPIGSGCVAQVYQGTWYDTRQDVEAGQGKKVAVKVCHPQIQEKVAADMTLLKWVAETVEAHFPKTQWLGGLDIVVDFEDLMHRQMYAPAALPPLCRHAPAAA